LAFPHPKRPATPPSGWQVERRRKVVTP
jgi:hypothetical protein